MFGYLLISSKSKFSNFYQHVQETFFQSVKQFESSSSLVDAFKILSTIFQFCLFDLILYVPSTIFQLYRDGLNQY